METERFDRLTTSLAQSRSRRATLGALAVALLGAGGAALLGEQSTSAKAKSKARKKGHHGHKGHGRHHGGGFPGPGTCADGADACLGAGTPICTCHNGQFTGLCRTSVEGGTVCAIDITSPAETACDQCTTNADCIRLGFPAGSSCVVDSGPNCRNCLENNLGTCVAPCGFQEPA